MCVGISLRNMFDIVVKRYVSVDVAVLSLKTQVLKFAFRLQFWFVKQMLIKCIVDQYRSLNWMANSLLSWGVVNICFCALNIP